MLPSRRRSHLLAVLPILVVCCTSLLVSTLHADDEARWYRGNTHAHSLWSDGDEFPEMVADWYKKHGYDFLALSDHRTVMTGQLWRNIDQGKHPVPSAVVEKCHRRFDDDWLVVRNRDNHDQVKLKTFDEVRDKLAEPGKFLLIQSEEITSKFRDCDVHVTAINLAEAIPSIKGDSVVDTITKSLNAVVQQSRRLNRPMLAHVNHPNWHDYDISPEELAETSAARFVEVCNAGPDIRNLGDATHRSSEKLWDVANTLRIAKMKAAPLYGIGSDDSHHYQEFSPDNANPGRAWIMVRSTQLEPGALIDAMNRGDFYVSTGVLLRDIAYDAKQRSIHIAVKSEPGVRYTIEFIGTLEGADPTGQPAEAGEHSERPGRLYSPEVGKVLSGVVGDSATYQFTGKELYVRAVVRSDKPIPNAPANDVQKQEALCQPMGWR